MIDQLLKLKTIKKDNFTQMLSFFSEDLFSTLFYFNILKLYSTIFICLTLASIFLAIL